MLFGMFADRLRLTIVDAQYAFPDVTVNAAGRRVGVELEFRSRSFRTHVANGQYKTPSDCELLVCWQHDWPGMPESLTVLELRKVFGIGWSAWLLPMYARYADSLPKGKVIQDGWSVPSKAGPDDLLLVYRPGRDGKAVTDIMRVRSPVRRVQAGWREGLDWMAAVQRVATLERPLALAELEDAGLSTNAVQGRPDVTSLWPKIRRRIVASNPTLKHVLQRMGER